MVKCLMMCNRYATIKCWCLVSLRKMAGIMHPIDASFYCMGIIRDICVQHNCFVISIWRKPSRCVTIQVYIFYVRHNSNIIKYTIVSANTFKSFWLHVSTALRPSSGQHIKIKYLQCAYSVGSHSVYNCNVCNITTIKTYIYG